VAFPTSLARGGQDLEPSRAPDGASESSAKSGQGSIPQARAPTNGSRGSRATKKNRRPNHSEGPARRCCRFSVTAPERRFITLDAIDAFPQASRRTVAPRRHKTNAAQATKQEKPVSVCRPLVEKNHREAPPRRRRRRARRAIHGMAGLGLETSFAFFPSQRGRKIGIFSRV